MTPHRLALLACLAWPAFAAQAQTHAPAEERPGRLVMVPMSVERPAGAGWTLVRRSETDLTFLHPADREFNSMVAIAGARVPEKRPRSTEDLVAHLREELKSKTDNKRFEVLAEDIRPLADPKRKCVRYRQQARDLAATGQDGKPQLIDLHGQVCLHPDDEGVLLVATLSERAAADAAGRRNIAEMAERFYAGVRPHPPLRGDDWRPFAEKGDANAQVWLARTLFRANKAEEALVWLGRAAEKGHPEAQATFGLSHLVGSADKRKPEEGVKWLRQAAERGYPKAEGLLALTLITMDGVRNAEEGVRWARKAAADGDAVGQSLLAELLFFGKSGVEKNEAEGSAWYRKAAESGDPNAQYALARMLAQGIGMAPDPAQSTFWLGLAAAQGHADAKKVIEQMKRPPAPPEGQSR